MFSRMIRGLLARQWKKMLLISFTIGLGASLATAMLSVMLDVGDKINQELKTYGANIVVTPKQASVFKDLYELQGGSEQPDAYLREADVGKVKTIFWAFNIVDFAPYVRAEGTLADGSQVQVLGSWFNHHLSLPDGEELDAGINSLRSWWDITDGEWLDEKKGGKGRCMVGKDLAKQANIKVGDTVTVAGKGNSLRMQVTGIFDAGGDEDGQLFTFLSNAQALGGLQGKVGGIEVSALTTPDNELSEAAAKNPKGLSVKQYETWYCTAYASSICYQLMEAIPNAAASPVRQVAESEGTILEKTQLLMIMITILSMIGSALGICNLVTNSVMERSSEIGLMKAIGAQNRDVVGLVMTEILATAMVGGVAGFFLGMGFAQIIGHTVFSSSIAIRPMVIPIVAVAVLLITITGSLPAIRMLLQLKPTEVLHERV